MYLALPFFDRAVVTAPAEPWSPAEDAALKRFLRLTPADRLAASHHVHAYYRDIHAALGGEDWLDARMKRPGQPEMIWRHVRPQRLVFLGAGGTVFVAIEARVPWEEAYGLMLVWQDGNRLVKVGGYDGQPLNGDEAGIVYRATDPALTTRQP